MPKKRKKAPSGSRLDELGYCLHMPMDFEPRDISWVGKSIGKGEIVNTTNESDGSKVSVTFYKSVRLGTETYTVGEDIVLLLPEEKLDLEELSRIMQLYSVDGEEDSFCMTNQWLWRPQHLEMEDESGNTVDVDAAKFEVFFTPTFDVLNDVCTIERCALRAPLALRLSTLTCPTRRQEGKGAAVEA